VAASAAPKNYVFTGKFTSNRGNLYNIPLVGNTPCGGAGLSNLRIMSGPGLTGPHTLLSMTGMSMVPIATPAVHPGSQPANGINRDYGCAGYVPGRKLTTTGAGVGGEFVLPDHVLSKPLPGDVLRFKGPVTPLKQLFTSWAITGPRKASTQIMTTTPSKSVTAGMAWKNNWKKFQKNAHLVQPGRAQGAAFTYCWGNPGCANAAGGTKPLIVKYTGGGNAFGGTMAYVISSGPNPSNVGVAEAPGGPIGFAYLTQTKSQPSGRGYGVRLTGIAQSGPHWGMYQATASGKITMLSFYLGMNFPAANNYNRGFPFTTGTVLARNTGTVAGNKVATTLTAKGGDSVTAMGKRNISLVAGGMARTTTGPFIGNFPEIAQLYMPEPDRASQLFAGVLGLLAIAAARRCGC
jgi:hypothetical protein